MTIQEAKQRLLFQLYHRYDERESANISDWVLEHLTGWKKIDRIINKTVRLSIKQEEDLERYITDLSAGRPVQYVLGEAWFQGMRFYVNESTLIPRPETEELVEWLLQDFTGSSNAKILDIGSGSGCIPISLSKKFPAASIISADISKEALAVAAQNAAALHAKVEFLERDMLETSGWNELPMFDAIISNPPYVPEADREEMAAHVVNFEPSVALFVPDNDPLVFYRAIAANGKQHLKRGGAVYVEIHESLGNAVCALFTEAGYNQVELRKDMQERDRMVKAVWK